MSDLIGRIKKLEWTKAELEAENNRIISLLATERDRFGKRETELMAENSRFRAALEMIAKGGCADKDNCDCPESIAREALKNIEICGVPVKVDPTMKPGEFRIEKEKK